MFTPMFSSLWKSLTLTLATALVCQTALGQSVDGLYLMTRFWPSSGLEVAAYWFHNGAVVVNPIGSARTLDVAAERAIHPKAVGTFKLSAGQLVMAMADGNHQAKYEPETKGCFGWDAGIFCPVEIFRPGTTLDGTFSGGASVGGGAVMSSTTITFKADGSYQRESVGSFSSKGAIGGVSGGTTGNERGKYRVEGTALHLIPDGGKEMVVSTFPYDDDTKGPAPRSLYFSGGMLKRIK